MVTAAYSLTTPSLKQPLAWSAGLHAALLALLLLSAFTARSGEAWSGGGGGAVTIGLAAGVPGVPLPRPDVVTTSRTVDPTRGLYKSEPRAKKPDTSSRQLPEFERNKPPRYVTRPSRTLEDTTPPPTGAIPYGQGGTPSLPYTHFTMGTGTPGGMSLGGPGGDFATRFPTYVNAVRQRISGNWLQSTIDPAIQFAPRVVLTFQILRDGTVTNFQFTRRSGNASVDASAYRAVLESSPLERLPSEYSGSSVSVEFWFEFRR